MHTYLFLLGNTPQLSAAELQATFPDQTLERLHPRWMKLETPTEIDPPTIQDQLGGTVKIIQVIKNFIAILIRIFGKNH